MTSDQFMDSPGMSGRESASKWAAHRDRLYHPIRWIFRVFASEQAAQAPPDQGDGLGIMTLNVVHAPVEAVKNIPANAQVAPHRPAVATIMRRIERPAKHDRCSIGSQTSGQDKAAMAFTGMASLPFGTARMRGAAGNGGVGCGV